MRNKETQVLRILRECGYRITVPRRRILKAILEKKGLFSAASLSKGLPRIELSTIYRTLFELESVGILREVRIQKDTALYELMGAHHDHLVCVQCGKIEHIDCVQPKHPKTMGRHFSRIVGHEITWSGVCASCV